jgi:DNA polymerase III subunit gamma/tau
VLFIFATTEAHKVPETIQSRCQRFDFRRIAAPDIHQRLREIADKESLQVSETALACIVKAADGSMRDAQSLMDQVISYCGSVIEDAAVMDILGMAGRELFFRISGAVFRQDAAGCLEALDELYRKGYDISQFYRDLAEHFRNLLIARTLADPSVVLEAPEGEIEELRKQAESVGMEDLQRLLALLLRAEGDVLRSEFPRMSLEVTLIRMAGLARLEPLERILEKVDALGRGGPATGQASGGSPPGGQARERAPRRDPAPAAAPRPRTAPQGTGTAASAGVPPSPGTRESDGEPPPAGPVAAPEPEPADPAEAAAGPGIAWNADGAAQAFVNAVRRERRGLGVLLEDVPRWEIRADRIRAYCEENSFVYQRLRQPDVQKLLSRVAGECFSGSMMFQPCAFRPDPGDGEGPGAAGAGRSGPQVPADGKGAPDREGEEVRSHPVVQQTLELFSGEITEVKAPGGKVRSETKGEKP